jgi:hypothetical protein
MILLARAATDMVIENITDHTHLLTLLHGRVFGKLNVKGKKYLQRHW